MARAPERDEPDGVLHRLQLLDDSDEAIAAFLDELDLRGPRERELLEELAHPAPLADASAFAWASKRLVRGLEALGRHGYHSASVSRRLGPLRTPARFFVELVARYLVVTYLRRVSTDVRNLYWLREMQARPGSDERVLLRRARRDAEGLTVVFHRRPIGVPSFLFGGILFSLAASAGRLTSGVAFGSWLAALSVALVGVIVALSISWAALRGAAMAGRRIRLAVRDPLHAVWAAVGHCGRPPRDQSRKAALVAIVLTFAAWIIVPLVVGLALAS
jgi:hypothetical protein